MSEHVWSSQESPFGPSRCRPTPRGSVTLDSHAVDTGIATEAAGPRARVAQLAPASAVSFANCVAVHW